VRFQITLVGSFRPSLDRILRIREILDEVGVRQGDRGYAGVVVRGRVERRLIAPPEGELVMARMRTLVVAIDGDAG
jgi:hypothetical protein